MMNRGRRPFVQGDNTVDKCNMDTDSMSATSLFCCSNGTETISNSTRATAEQQASAETSHDETPRTAKRLKLKEMKETRRQLKCLPTKGESGDIRTETGKMTTATSQRPICITPDDPQTPESPEVWGFTPSTPVSRFSIVNLETYQFTGALDEKLDERDAWDPRYCTDLVDDIYACLREKETHALVSPNYLDVHPSINAGMRSKLIDWIIEVHWGLQLTPEVLYLAVNHLDRYMARVQNVPRRKYQLVAVACLMIACKQEEVYAPTVIDFTEMCVNIYSNADIVKMEARILKALQFRIWVPTPYAFLARFLKAAHADRKMLRLSFYTLDSTLQSSDLLCFLPSQIAAASIYIARTRLGKYSWSPTLLKYSLYCEEEVAPVADALVSEQFALDRELFSVRRKYGERGRSLSSWDDVDAEVLDAASSSL